MTSQLDELVCRARKGDPRAAQMPIGAVRAQLGARAKELGVSVKVAQAAT